MTTRRLSLLIVRLITFYFLVSMISTIGYYIMKWNEPARFPRELIGPYAAGILLYFIVMTGLFIFARPIARLLSRGVPNTRTQTQWSSTELLGLIVAGVSFFTTLEALPHVLNQLYAFLNYHQTIPESGVGDVPYLRNIVSGLVIATLRVILGVAGMVYSTRLARFWERAQSYGFRQALKERAV
jgi:hypothetical protein